MCRVDRVGRAVLGLRVVAFGFLLVMLAWPMAWAADFIPRGQPIPQNIRVVGTTATGVNASMTTMYLNATGNTTYNKVPVPISSSTLGKLGKAAIKRLGPAAALYQTLKGIIDGVGWFIDEAQKQIQTPGQPRDALGQTVYCLQAGSTSGAGFNCANTPGLLSAVASAVNGNFSSPCAVDGFQANGRANYKCTRNSDGQMARVATESIQTRPVTGWPATHNNYNEGSEPSQISDYDLGNLLKQYPQAINAILIDPETGAPIRTQEVVDALNELRKALEAANGTGTPQPDLETDPGWENGEETPHETEWPGFCEYAATLCEWLQWTKETEPMEEPMEVPWEDSPFEESTWSAGLGGGTCPSAYSFSVSVAGHSANIAFEYQPICSFASTMRPVVYAMSLLVAAFIVAGLRNNKGA